MSPETPGSSAVGGVHTSRDIVQEVGIPPVGLAGTLAIPAGARALVLFAHGSGSSRLSPRNTFVADALRRAGLATLLFDLLTPPEAADRANVFDIALLADRLAGATQWAAVHDTTRRLGCGYFGASTGAAAALVAATSRIGEDLVGAVVSRGGRPDLAGWALPAVKAPTLLIVGSLDREVLALNRAALTRMRCAKALEIVPGASHLFEEPGTLDRVIALTRDWFTRHLARPG